MGFLDSAGQVVSVLSGLSGLFGGSGDNSATRNQGQLLDELRVLMGRNVNLGQTFTTPINMKLASKVIQQATGNAPQPVTQEEIDYYVKQYAGTQAPTAEDYAKWSEPAKWYAAIAKQMGVTTSSTPNAQGTYDVLNTPAASTGTTGTAPSTGTTPVTTGTTTYGPYNKNTIFATLNASPDFHGEYGDATKDLASLLKDAQSTGRSYATEMVKYYAANVPGFANMVATEYPQYSGLVADKVTTVAPAQNAPTASDVTQPAPATSGTSSTPTSADTGIVGASAAPATVATTVPTTTATTSAVTAAQPQTINELLQGVNTGSVQGVMDSYKAQGYGKIDRDVADAVDALKATTAARGGGMGGSAMASLLSGAAQAKAAIAAGAPQAAVDFLGQVQNLRQAAASAQKLEAEAAYEVDPTVKQAKLAQAQQIIDEATLSSATAKANLGLVGKEAHAKEVSLDQTDLNNAMYQMNAIMQSIAVATGDATWAQIGLQAANAYGNLSASQLAQLSQPGSSVLSGFLDTMNQYTGGSAKSASNNGGFQYVSTGQGTPADLGDNYMKAFA